MKTLKFIEEVFENPLSTDLCINGPSVFVDQGNGMKEEPRPLLEPNEVRSWLLETLSQCGKSWDARSPFIDATFRIDHQRFRVHAVFPPVSDSGLIISIRKVRGSENLEMSPIGTRWCGSANEFHTLTEAIQKGESILISGATGSGKTTLASELLSLVPSSERVIALEDTPELNPSHPHFIALQSRPANVDGFGEITLRTLLRQTLRMRPDRIVLGECRGAEVLELLQALNTGHRGGLATLHANSPRDALKRLETLALLASPSGLPVQVIREWIATGVQWIAQVERTSSGRIIRAVSQVCGMESGTIVLRGGSGRWTA